MKNYYVYILASDRNGTLYIGITNSISRRVWEHKNKVIKGFTEKYGVDKLVHYEVFDEVGQAILREKHLKKWDRKWKLRLIEENNPNWIDLYNHL